jgi:hypothetical protein
MFSFIIFLLLLLLFIILHLITRTPLSTNPPLTTTDPPLLHHDPPRNPAPVANQTHRKSHKHLHNRPYPLENSQTTHKSQPTTGDPPPKKPAAHCTSKSTTIQPTESRHTNKSTTINTNPSRAAAPTNPQPPTNRSVCRAHSLSKPTATTVRRRRS